MTTIDTRSDRDVAAINRIFTKLDHLESELGTIRALLAVEVGFERVRVTELRKGDRVRTTLGTWHTVDHVVFRDMDGEEPHYRVVTDGGSMVVEAETERHPFPPMVTRAYELDETVF